MVDWGLLGDVLYVIDRFLFFIMFCWGSVCIVGGFVIWINKYYIIIKICIFYFEFFCWYDCKGIVSLMVNYFLMKIGYFDLYVCCLIIVNE